MYLPGISAFEFNRYTNALTEDHWIRITVDLLDINEKHLNPLTSMIYDGQVTMSTSTEYSRSASIRLMDIDGLIDLDDSSPSDGGLYYGRMIKVTYLVWQWWWSSTPVEIPIFTGPITDVKRQGIWVDLEASSKEIMAQRPGWFTEKYNKGDNVVDAIRKIMVKYTGETKFKFPTNNHVKLGKNHSISKETIPWVLANKFAKSLGMYLYYNGDGYLVLRPYPTKASFVYSSGDHGSLKTEPAIHYDLSVVKNTFWVKGGMPKGSKKAISVHKYLPPSHPMYPWSKAMLRHGTPTILLDIIDNSSITHTSQANTAIKNRMKVASLQGVDAQFTSLVIPHLEEGDVVGLATDEYNLPFRMTDMTIPFSAAGDSSVGFLKNVKVKVRSK